MDKKLIKVKDHIREPRKILGLSRAQIIWAMYGAIVRHEPIKRGLECRS